MKLIFCTTCEDIVALTRWKKSCKCGETYGKYVDEVHAKVSPGAIPMAADTTKLAFVLTLEKALKQLNESLEIPSVPHDGCDIVFEEFDE